jgi:hypothetical protein
MRSTNNLANLNYKFSTSFLDFGKYDRSQIFFFLKMSSTDTVIPPLPSVELPPVSATLPLPLPTRPPVVPSPAPPAPVVSSAPVVPPPAPPAVSSTPIVPPPTAPPPTISEIVLEPRPNPVGVTTRVVPAPRPTTQVNPSGGSVTSVPLPPTAESSTAGGLSSGAIIAISLISVGIVLAALSIFVFKYFISRLKKRNAKVELGDAFGKPMTDNMFSDSSPHTLRQENAGLEQINNRSMSGNYHHYHNGQYYDPYVQYSYSEGAENLQPKPENVYYYQDVSHNQELPHHEEIGQNEYYSVNRANWNQHYQQPYYPTSPQDVTDQGATNNEAIDPFTFEQQGYTYPTQTRYNSLRDSQ